MDVGEEYLCYKPGDWLRRFPDTDYMSAIYIYI